MLSEITLRPYQTDLIQQAGAFFQTNNRLLLQLNTGGGKTVIFSAIAKQYERVLVVSHRKELVQQAASKLATVTGQSVGIIKAGYEIEAGKPYQSASIQSLRSRQHRYEPFDLVVIDEAHHATAKTYLDLFDLYPNAKFLGVTATPCRTNGEGFADIFEHLITGPSYSELRTLRYLADYRYFKAEHSVVTKGARKVRGEYSAADLNRLNEPSELALAVASAYLEQLSGLSTIVFAPSVRHSLVIAEQMRARGIAAAHIDGDTDPDERDRLTAMLERRDLDVISNVGIFTEGYDYPGLEAIQICSPTLSLSKHLQMIGRVLRPAAGKERGVILDHTQNYLTHGLPCTERSWSLKAGQGGKQAAHRVKANEDTGCVEADPSPIPVDIAVQIKEVKLSPADRDELLKPWRRTWREIRSWVEWGKVTKRQAITHMLAHRHYWYMPEEVALFLESYGGYKPGWAYYRHAEQKRKPGYTAAPIE